MPRVLLNRIGFDTLAKLESAARRRHAEARQLRPKEPLGALYLYGYTIEMRLKAAYYRLVSVPENWDLDVPTPPAVVSPRRDAQVQIQNLIGLGHSAQAGHHLVGWATLVITTRAGHPVLGPFATGFETQLNNHAQAAGRQWREILRYRANRPYDEEVDAVVDAANWIRGNYHRLWS
jgi:hypothetical protein